MRKAQFLLIGMLLISVIAVNLLTSIGADGPNGTRSPGAGIEITPSANKTGKPTDTVSYQFTVKNVGDIIDNFTFYAESQLSWPVNLSKNIEGPLAINATTTVWVNVTIPMGVPADTVDNLTFRARSENQTWIVEMVKVNTTVIEAFILSIDIEGVYAKTSSIDPPGVANYTLTVKNKGNVNVTITLKHSLPVAGWQVEFPKFPNGKVAIDEANLTHEGIENVNLTITAPSSAQPDDQMTITVWGEKTDTPPTWSSRDYQDDITITTIVQSRLGVIFNQEEIEGKVDFYDTLFNFTIENSGNKDIMIDLTLDKDLILDATLDLYKLIVRVGEQPVRNTLRVSTAANAPLGNYTINVSATDNATGVPVGGADFYFIITPKLNVTDIKVSKDEPMQYKEVTLTATITNIGYVAATEITVKFYDGSKKIGEYQFDPEFVLNATETAEADIKWSPSEHGNRTIRVAVDVEGIGNFSSHGHGTDIAEGDVIIPVEINWQPYYFVIYIIIVIILGIAVIASLLELRFYTGVPAGAGYDEMGEGYEEGELPTEEHPGEDKPFSLEGKEEEDERTIAPFGMEGRDEEFKEELPPERTDREMFRPPRKPERKPYDRPVSRAPPPPREPAAISRENELRDEISDVRDKLYKTKSMGVDTNNIDNLLTMAKKSLDSGDTDKAKQYINYANDRLGSLMAKREEAVRVIREAKEVLSGMRDAADVTIVENFIVKADSLLEKGDFREAINYANKAKERALRLQRREMRL
ncbi:MAG: hypothetical protein JSW28_09220 [Thermoplasmata archaeon]|nr:MAG: hypothetical protein JSW28_09220 [Thermoplasmata archaeon]